MRILTGHLEYVPHDGYYMMLDDTPIPDDFEIVRMADGDDRQPPLNTYIELAVDDEQYIVDWRIPGPPIPAEPMPVIKTALFKFIDPDAPEEIELDEWEDVREYALRCERHFKYFSYERLDIEWRGFVARFDGYCTPPLYAKQITDPYDKGDFEPTHYMSEGGKSTRSACGLATLGGNRGWKNDAYFCTWKVLMHEHTHSLGEQHSGLIESTGKEKEYGNPICLQGSADSKPKGYISGHLINLDWYEPDEVTVIETSQQVLIVPVTPFPYHDLHPNQYQHIIIRVPGHPDYTLSIYKGPGALYPVLQPDLLYIDRMDPMNQVKLIEPALRPGESKILPNGVVVTYLEYANEVARVEVAFTAEDHNSIAPVPIPEGFPVPQDIVPMERRHTGAYYLKRFSGQGINVFIIRDLVALFWYTWDDEGSLIYWIGNGNIVGGYANLTMTVTSGGTFDNPKQRTEQKVGIAQLYFVQSDNPDNPGDHAVLKWDMPGIYGTGALKMEPVVNAFSEDTGAWWMTEKAGSGLGQMLFDHQTASFAENDHVCAGYWYTFDDRGGLLWLILNGKRGEDGVYSLTIKKCYGGKHLFYADVEEKKVGTATLEKVGEVFKFTYDLQADGLIASGSQFLNEKF